MVTHRTLTVADIQRCFWVDDTGTVRWKQSVEPVAACHLHWFSGTVAGTVTVPKHSGVQYRHIGYVKHNTKHRIFAHVIAFVLHSGKFPEGQVDHIDGDGLNNREVNLRDATQRVNLCNTKLHTRNVSGVRGVTPVKQYPGMWRASASVDNTTRYLYKGYDFFLACCARLSFEAHNDSDNAYSGRGNHILTKEVQHVC